jgi:hypothetical protein
LGPTICSKTKRLAELLCGRRLGGTSGHYRVPEGPWAAGRKNPLGLAERIGCLQLGNRRGHNAAGFTYVRETGIDTFMGLFTSKDGSLVIEHDIGELAAEHAGMGNLETLIEGSRVRFGSVAHDDEKGGKEYFFKVSFPDASCANFYLESANEKDSAIIQFIARSFRPRGWLPSVLRPLLPEVLRSDCRYRVKLPLGL